MEKQEGVEVGQSPHARRHLCTRDIDANRSIPACACDEAHQETDGVEMPLEFFELDRTDAEYVSQYDRRHDDYDQREPDPGNGGRQPIQYRFYAGRSSAPFSVQGATRARVSDGFRWGSGSG